jgi:hypothetical protein
VEANQNTTQCAALDDIMSTPSDQYQPPTDEEVDRLGELMEQVESESMKHGNLEKNIEGITWARSVSTHLNTLYTLRPTTEAQKQLQRVLIGVVFAILQWFCMTLYLDVLYKTQIKPTLRKIRAYPGVEKLMAAIEAKLKEHESLTVVFTAAKTLPARLEKIWKGLGGASPAAAAAPQLPGAVEDEDDDIQWSWPNVLTVQNIAWNADAPLEVVRKELDALVDYASALRDNYKELERRVVAAIERIEAQDYTFDRSMGKDIIDALKAKPDMRRPLSPIPPAGDRPQSSRPASARGASTRPPAAAAAAVVSMFDNPAFETSPPAVQQTGQGRRTKRASPSPRALASSPRADERTWWQWFWGIR